MLEKPAFRSEEYARTFQDTSVVEVYHQRPPYPEAVFEKLADLADHSVKSVLDVGTGLGEIARPMAQRGWRVDAVDFSEGMIARARMLPGGDHPGVTWVVSNVEKARFNRPYGLITAAACLHWFDQNVAMERFADIVSPGGYLAIIEREWETGIADTDLISEYSANQDYIDWNVVEAITNAGLFELVGEVQAGCEPWNPTIKTYLDCRHSQNGLSRERMGEKRAKAFDDLVSAQIEHQCSEGTVAMIDGRIQARCKATIVWGKPKRVPR